MRCYAASTATGGDSSLAQKDEPPGTVEDPSDLGTIPEEPGCAQGLARSAATWAGVMAAALTNVWRT